MKCVSSKNGNLVMIDIDKRIANLAQVVYRLSVAARILGFSYSIRYIAVTKHGWHILILLDKCLPAQIINTIQACLGSDWRRELQIARKLMAGNYRNWNCLYSVKYKRNFKDWKRKIVSFELVVGNNLLKVHRLQLLYRVIYCICWLLATKLGVSLNSIRKLFKQQ